jgi:hypothetical protein
LARFSAAAGGFPPAAGGDGSPGAATKPKTKMKLVAYIVLSPVVWGVALVVIWKLKH